MIKPIGSNRLVYPNGVPHHNDHWYYKQRDAISILFSRPQGECPHLACELKCKFLSQTRNRETNESR